MEEESRHERIYTGIRRLVYADVGYAGRLGSLVDPIAVAAGAGGGSDAAAGPATLAAPSAALLAVASDGLLRVSEVAALNVGDVQAEADGSGRLLVGASKTDQEGRGAVLYLGAPTVSRVNAWLAAAGHQDRAAVSPRAKGRPLSASRAGYPVTVSELVARNRWPPAMPGHYARGQLAARGAVARVRYGRG